MMKLVNLTDAMSCARTPGTDRQRDLGNLRHAHAGGKCVSLHEIIAGFETQLSPKCRACRCHMFISVLGVSYFGIPLNTDCVRAATNRLWATVRAVLSTHQRLTIEYNVKEHKQVQRHHLRCVAMLSLNTNKFTRTWDSLTSRCRGNYMPQNE